MSCLLAAVQKGRVPPPNMLVYPQHLGCALGSWHIPDSSSLPMISNFCVSGLVSGLVKADTYCTSRFSVSGEGEHFGHLLIGIVEWAKKVPHFSELVPCDQAALLKIGWQELFLITAAQVGVPMPVAQMVSACLSSDTDRNLVMAQLQDMNRLLQHQLEKLQKLQLDAPEYACLKALVLLNPDTAGLTNPVLVESTQERVQCALLEYTHAHMPGQVARFGRVLLRLPTLRKIAAQLIDTLCSMRLLNRVSVESLIQSFLQQPSPLLTDCPVDPGSVVTSSLSSPCAAAVASGGHVPNSVAMTTHHVHPGQAWLAGLDAMGPVATTGQQVLTSLANITHHPQL